MTASMSYALRTIQFKADYESVIMEQILRMMQVEADFHQSSYEIHKNLAPRIDILRRGSEEVYTGSCQSSRLLTLPFRDEPS